MEDFDSNLTAGNVKAAMKEAGADFKKACKKAAEPMYTALTKVKADPGFAGLSEEVRGILAELLKGLPKAPK